MSTPTVSIIIPTYNYGHYIADAVDSALAQKDVSVEVIIVDDGSQDNTREVCEGYGDRVRYLSQENSGPSAARNLGLQHAHAPFTVFLDSDDVLHADMVAVLMKKFDDLGKDYAIVACRNEHIDSSGTVQQQTSTLPPQDREIVAQDLLIRNYFNPSSALVRTDVLKEAGGFDASLMSSEERDLWLRIALKHKVYKISMPLIKLRVHPESYSHNARRMHESMKQTIANGLRLGAGTFTLLQQQKARSYCEFEAFWMYRSEGKLFEAAIHLLKSWANLPWFPGINELGYKVFFRLRALRHLLISLVKVA